LSRRLSWEHHLLSAYNGGQFPVYRCLRSFAIRLPRMPDQKLLSLHWDSKIKMGQGACSSLLCFSRQPILWLYITMTNSLFTYLTYETNNRWHSIDAHFQNGAGSVSYSLLRINAVYTSFMNVCIQLPLRLPKMQDQNSWTRCWLSLLEWARERFSIIFGYIGSQCSRKEQQYTNVNILRLAMEYHNATINRKTWKLELEIGTNVSSQTRQDLWVDG